MTLREASALVTAALCFVGTAWYIWLVLQRDKLQPVLASWIIWSVGLDLGFATYWTTRNHNLVSNIGQATGAASVTAIFLVVLWVQWRDKKPAEFTRFQKWFLGTSSAIAIGWIILVWGLGRTGLVPNVLCQFLMLIGSFVTAEKLWKADRNTEPFFTWWCILIASLFALYVAIVSNDVLGVVYSVRATFTSLLLVVLMYRVASRQRRLALA